MKTLNGKYLPGTKGYADISVSYGEFMEDFKINKVCSKCWDGLMEFLSINKDGFEHKCSNCNYHTIFLKKYPIFKWRKN